MAGSSSNKAKSNSKKTNSSSGTKRKTSGRTTGKKRMSAAEKQRLEQQAKMREEIGTLLFLAFSILFTLCNFKVTASDGSKSSIIGSFGNAVSGIEFGIFGVLAYVAPILIFIGIIFAYMNAGLLEAKLKLWAGIILFLVLDTVAALLGGIDSCGSTIKEYYEFSKTTGTGGGVIGSLLGRGLHSVFGMVGTIVILLILLIISMVVLTERSFINGIKNGSKKVYETARDDARIRRERMEQRREEMRLRELAEEEEESMMTKRSDKRVAGVALDITIPKEDGKQDIHEISVSQKELLPQEAMAKETVSDKQKLPTPEQTKTEQSKPEILKQKVIEPDVDEDPLAHIQIRGLNEEQAPVQKLEPKAVPEQTAPPKSVAPRLIGEAPILNASPTEPVMERTTSRTATQQPQTISPSVRENAPGTSYEENTAKAHSQKVTVSEADLDISEDIKKQSEIAPKKKYVFPPLSLLKPSENKGNTDSARQLKETALHLQETLKTFGVNVTITDISQGPTVTRYELQPEQGVKVSKIVGLADDIKLNLAATDIRIEAPIPGKAAVGIEVPNKENSAVALRDLLETEAFQSFQSNIAFAVGKDIAGQTVVTDIAKMPHVLIAGATGSGKSVCINTLIMSILYKASPEDVKLIMIDPKVVELSVYNGIPHLMIPVVTDPKKAAGALHWGVAEMTDRYKKFADFNVRDLKGYNKKVEEMESNDGAPIPDKMPQIVIIVDELADLMMVAPGEVEESICRLAQLARAAGIHLVIATQRPSVDVITGLIKANMPSRIAFSVSSGVDSRTILDMNGAEKLLGKGDMLFYPQGLSKPSRVQGAFVSDKEVSDVVDFLKNECGETTYASDVEQKISAGVTAAGAGVFGQDSGSERDVYFYDAGTFIIEKDKASIGMLQRVFKIGFNRAARIMDQLCEAGVVGEEEGTKPRKVLMTQEQFEQLVNGEEEI